MVNLWQKDFGIKATCKMFLKFATGVNFINISYTFFLRTKTPKTQKDTDDLKVFFVFLGSAHVKSVH